MFCFVLVFFFIFPSRLGGSINLLTRASFHMINGISCISVSGLSQCYWIFLVLGYCIFVVVLLCSFFYCCWFWNKYDAITFCCIFINIKGEMFVCLSSCSSSPRYTCFTYTKIIKQNADCFWGNIPFCFSKLEVGKSW